MKRLMLGLILTLMPIEAFAIVRYMVQGMTCSEVQASVERDGVAILYQKAGSAPTRRAAGSVNASTKTGSDRAIGESPSSRFTTGGSQIGQALISD